MSADDSRVNKATKIPINHCMGSCQKTAVSETVVVVVVLLFYVHGKHLRSCQDGQLT